jgi:hypothetical protein
LPASISFRAVYRASLPRGEDLDLPLVFLVCATLGNFSSHCFSRRQARLGFCCRVDFPVGSAPLGPSVPAPIKSAARVSPFWRLICAGLCFAPVLICSAWTCSSTPCSVPLGPLFLLPHKALILLFSSVISLLFNPRSYSRLLGCSLISCGSTSSGFFLR